MDVKALKTQGGTLLIEGRIMGALPIRAVLTPDQARYALKLLNASNIWAVCTVLFRKGGRGAETSVGLPRGVQVAAALGAGLVLGSLLTSRRY